MAARSAAVLLVLASLVAAGCIGGKGDVTTASTNTNQTTSNATCFDSCKSIVAFEETNKTEEGSGGMDHQHDMWAGRDRVTLFATPAWMTPLAAVGAASYQATATFHPPQDSHSFVYEGTDHVEFTISNPVRHACPGGTARLNGHWICTDTVGNITGAGGAANAPAVADPTGGPTGLKLRYKHSIASEWIDAGELTWGAPLSIKLTDPKQADMPHATSSAWSFQVASPNQYDSTLGFTAKVDLLRGVGPVPLWPGHPNFYADTDSRKVLDVDAVACDGPAGSGTACALPDYAKSGPIKAQKLISYGTRTLYVWVNITEVFDPNPALATDNWFLYHWNTTGDVNFTDVFDTEKHGAAAKSHTWVLPVDDSGMDSPYADGSKWTFQLGGAFYKGGVSCYGGCADWGAKYHITIIATNHVLELKDYDMDCASEEYYCPSPNETAQQDTLRVVAGPDGVTAGSDGPRMMMRVE